MLKSMDDPPTHRRQSRDDICSYHATDAKERERERIMTAQGKDQTYLINSSAL